MIEKDLGFEKPTTSCRSRIGQKPIVLPAGVTCEIIDSKMHIKGPKGATEISWPQFLSIKILKDTLYVFPTQNDVSSMWGTMRSRLNSLVTGVSTGWTKTAKIKGVGYNAEKTASGISLFLGKSHRDVMTFGEKGKNGLPDGISISVEKGVTVTFSGIDAALVNDGLAKMVRLRPPEPYKGSGIIADGAIIERKVGKQKK